MSRQCTPFIIFSQEKKGQRTLWPGPQCVSFPVYDYILFESKRSSSFSVAWHFCSFLCRHHCPQWTGVTLWLLAVMLYFFFLIVLLYCTYFLLHWWWNIDDGRPTFALKVIFIFPLPTLSPFHPSLFLFSKMYCPLFFTSPIQPPSPPPPMSFPTSFLPQRLSHSTSTLFLCGFQPSK